MTYLFFCEFSLPKQSFIQFKFNLMEKYSKRAESLTNTCLELHWLKASLHIICWFFCYFIPMKLFLWDIPTRTKTNPINTGTYVLCPPKYLCFRKLWLDARDKQKKSFPQRSEMFFRNTSRRPLRTLNYMSTMWFTSADSLCSSKVGKVDWNEKLHMLQAASHLEPHPYNRAGL